MIETLNTELKDLVTDEVTALGYTLWGVEIVPTRYSCLVRVYIDAAKEQSGVSIDDCERVNRRLGLCLDQARYVLEISSPGLARKFFEPSQYARYIGKRIQVLTKQPMNGRRKFSGDLLACDEKTLSLRDSELAEPVQLAYAQIEKGKLEPDYKALFKKEK